MKIIEHSRPSSFTLAVYLFALVVLVRVLALSHLSGSAFLLPLRGDMHFYDEWAQRILRGELTDRVAFYGLPLYAYLLALIYRCFGYNPFIPALLQAIVDGGTAVLIYCLTLLAIPAYPSCAISNSAARSWQFVATHLPETAAVLAGTGWMFFVPAQAYSIVLMPTTWLVFIFWFVVWLIARRDALPTGSGSFLLGLLIGVTAMGVATILFLIPLVLAAIWLKDSTGKGSARIIVASMLLLGLVAGTSPCWIHNYFIARDPVILSAHSGINFWIGNNPEANGYPRSPPGLRAGQAAMLEDSIKTAESAAGRSLKRAQVAAYWSSRARAFIAAHPGEWLKLTSIKLRNFWNAFQYDDLSIINNLREHGVILAGVYFGLTAALASPGMLFACRAAPRARWIAAAIFLHMCALLPVFVTERYRLAAVPGLLVFATIGLSILWQGCMQLHWRTLICYGACLIPMTLFVSWPQASGSLWALDAYNSGWQALEAGNLTLAQKKLSTARAYVPTNPETNFALGNLRLAQGDQAGANSFYREVLKMDPKHKGALNNLGVLALEADDLPTAQFYFEAALAQNPRNGKTHFLLAKTALKLGDVATARREITKATELAPTQPEFLALRKELDQPKTIDR